MSLDVEIKNARQEIISDGYEMSIGELMSLYRDEELIINPEFQRLFRWDETQKTRFIESLLLSIPIPPIFVYQNEDGIWELIDGLQRLSTVFEFAGILRLPDGGVAPPTSLEGTKYLPSLAGKYWIDNLSEEKNGIGQASQLEIKRARIRVEILKKESDPLAKYELFQRLNTGGSRLSEQEVRNCIAVMLNRPFYEWLGQCATFSDFETTVDQTEYAIKRQATMELALRFFIFRNIPYMPGLDVHEYLDNGLIQISTNPDFSMETEGAIFKRTFTLLNRSLGSKVFKRWDGVDFQGKFLMSVFEVVATGVSKHIDEIEQMPQDEQDEFIRNKAKALWSDDTFRNNSGAGIRGTTRLARLLPMAEEFLSP